MTKYSKEQNKLFIYDTAVKNGVNPCTFLTYGQIESNFNNTAVSGSGTYVGLFQLSDGFGGIKGNDRYDPIKNTQGAINKYKHNREQIQKALGHFKEYYTYMAHQQGLTGFLHIAQNPNLDIHLSKYANNMLGNMPSNCKSWVRTCGDFMKCWEQRFNGIYGTCNINDLCKNDNKSKECVNIKIKTEIEWYEYLLVGGAVVGAVSVFAYALNTTKQGKKIKEQTKKLLKGK